MPEVGKTALPAVEVPAAESQTAINLLCASRGLPPSAANAKQATGEILHAAMVDQARAEAAEAAPKAPPMT